MLTRRFKIMLKQDFASWILGLVQEHTWLCVQQGPLIHEGRENMGFFLFVCFNQSRVFQKPANNYQSSYQNFRINGYAVVIQIVLATRTL